MGKKRCRNLGGEVQDMTGTRSDWKYKEEHYRGMMTCGEMFIFEKYTMHVSYN